MRLLDLRGPDEDPGRAGGREQRAHVAQQLRGTRVVGGREVLEIVEVEEEPATGLLAGERDGVNGDLDERGRRDEGWRPRRLDADAALRDGCPALHLAAAQHPTLDQLLDALPGVDAAEGGAQHAPEPRRRPRPRLRRVAGAHARPPDDPQRDFQDLRREVERAPAALDFDRGSVRDEGLGGSAGELALDAIDERGLSHPGPADHQGARGFVGEQQPPEQGELVHSADEELAQPFGANVAGAAELLLEVRIGAKVVRVPRSGDRGHGRRGVIPRLW
ncbi:MAG TPA: hypothetical protein VFY16_08305 [Gemmatimonadaceae bacterium]|nr:hypothetical protein [Gemmatimonadaceae bacterium]